MRRNRLTMIVVLMLLLTAAAAAAHDLFLKPDRFHAAPNTTARIAVLNGTFTSSESAVTWDRVADARVITPAGSQPIVEDQWMTAADRSDLRVDVGEAGTYVIGVSTDPRVLRLGAEDFNTYLATEGVPEILELRRREGELDQPASERYAKHVKTLIQVGERRTDGFSTVLGYPAELVPLVNPYALTAGDDLSVRALVDGRPVPDLVLIAGGRTPSGGVIDDAQVRTGTDGMARIRLESAGQWYVKFIHMIRVPADSAADYESKWATLTFEIR